MNEVWIIDAARTARAVGKPRKGAFANVHPQRLLATVLEALATRCDLTTADIDDVIAGCGNQIGKQRYCIARMAALDAGWDDRAVGLTIDRFCGSGLSAVSIGTMGILSGEQHLIVAGGVESMSHTWTYDPIPFIDAGNEHLRNIHPQPSQGVCADLIATLEGISRQELDQYALQSQARAAIAMNENRFERSIVPVKDDQGHELASVDENPRPETTLETLSSLSPAFGKYYDAVLDDSNTTFKALVSGSYPDIEVNHVHHAGNSSSVADGAGALVLASPDYARSHLMAPRARVVSMATAGDSPELMLNAPVPAAKAALKRAGMTIKDIDLLEVNEAFAVVPIKFCREFDLSQDIVNVNGGAIALGHPIGATGAILLNTLLDELERRNLETGLVTLCAAGGMAPAMIIERMS